MRYLLTNHDDVKTGACFCRPNSRHCPAYSRLTLARKAQRARLRRQAPADLMERLKTAFRCQCQHCGRFGDDQGIGVPYEYGYWMPDRIDSSRGYTPDNVTLACGMCNSRKGNRYVPVLSLAAVRWVL